MINLHGLYSKSIDGTVLNKANNMPEPVIWLQLYTSTPLYVYKSLYLRTHMFKMAVE